MCFHGPVLICCADHGESDSSHDRTFPRLQKLHRTFPRLQKLHTLLEGNALAALRDRLPYRDMCLVLLTEAGGPEFRAHQNSRGRNFDSWVVAGSARDLNGKIVHGLAGPARARK